MLKKKKKKTVIKLHPEGESTLSICFDSWELYSPKLQPPLHPHLISLPELGFREQVPYPYNQVCSMAKHFEWVFVICNKEISKAKSELSVHKQQYESPQNHKMWWGNKSSMWTPLCLVIGCGELGELSYRTWRRIQVLSKQGPFPQPCSAERFHLLLN